MIKYICDKCKRGITGRIFPSEQRIGDKSYDLCPECNKLFCQEILPKAQKIYDEILLSWIEHKKEI